MPHDSKCSPLQFLSEWLEFPSAPCLAGKKIDDSSRLDVVEIARVAWHASFSASITRKDLQFGTWTDPSFQQHYRFRPTTSGSRSGWLISTPNVAGLWHFKMWWHTAKSSCVQSFQISKKPTTLQAAINIVVATTVAATQADCHHIRYIYSLSQYETVMHRTWKNNYLQNNNTYLQ